MRVGSGLPPCTLHAITWRYTSCTQSRDALRVQPRLRGETLSLQLEILSLSFFLSLSISPYRSFSSVSIYPHLVFRTLNPLGHHLSSSANPAFSSGLSLSRQMATITYMCQYITHTANRASSRWSFFDKVHHHEPSVYSRCSRPIPHLPTLRNPPVVVTPFLAFLDPRSPFRFFPILYISLLSSLVSRLSLLSNGSKR